MFGNFLAILRNTADIAQAAYEKKIPCFCADFTVCPAMVEWNKAVAARLPAFPGIGDLGLVETNGHMNFRNWERMRNDLACPKAHWTRTEKGVFECDFIGVRAGRPYCVS